MQEATKVSEEQIAANVREAAMAFNAALDRAKEAGMVVRWVVLDECDVRHRFSERDCVYEADITKVTTY